MQLCIFSVLAFAQFFMNGRKSFLALRFLIAFFQGGFIPVRALLHSLSALLLATATDLPRLDAGRYPYALLFAPLFSPFFVADRSSPQCVPRSLPLLLL